jgi:surfeit locus 1 family protein
VALKGQRWVVAIAALATALLTARLGLWQLDRAAQKQRLQEAQHSQRMLPPLTPPELARDAAGAAAQVQRRAVVEGQWLTAQTVYLDNRPMNGRTGFYALTPLRLPDGSALLVQRGWWPRDMADRTRIAAPAPAAGVVHVQGHIALEPSRAYDLGGAGAGAIRQNLDLAAYARESGLPLRPFTLVQDDGAEAVADGLLRQWPQPASDLPKHYGYAFQWFALCALDIGLYVWFQLIRPRRSRQP